MAISYPRELPGYRLSDGAIDIIDNVSASPSGKGAFINRSQVNDPIWRGRFSMGPMPLSEAATWFAWKNSLQGGLRTFIAYDPRRSRPIAYPTANASTDISSGWAGTATVAALGAGGALGLTGLPSAYQIKAGDRIGIEQGSPLRRGYYEALEDVTASAGAATVTVAPFLHTSIFTVGATARLWRPKCELIIDWSTWSQSGDANFPTVSFEAWQKL